MCDACRWAAAAPRSPYRSRRSISRVAKSASLPAVLSSPALPALRCLFVAPKQNVAAVTILAGPASLPGDVVIGIGQRLMAAALEDSGRMCPQHAGNSPPPVTTGGKFNSTVPADARIVTFAPSGVIVFDSLFDVPRALAIVPGSLVLFIGGAGSAFEVTVS